ncbi:GntR family transcriptional regulator [Phaeovulum sp. W22_SRMD_FR3]|uniref:GntR family transcriptional regulator n=1 Tax=Phaeovulum sp. W22_SRMD_FR3 TaxID=3240274 RepID=UPI003F96B663
MLSNELSGKISTRLAQDIVAGDIALGAHIRTQQVANRYNVSRTPVREALILLEQMGFLVHHPNRGYFVAETIPSEAVDELVAQATQERDIYQNFAEDWLTDRLPDVVTEQALRQRYSLTKAGVLEILARATREGWAERREGYGWHLLPVAKTAEAFDEIYRFRMAIEPAAMLEPSFEINRTAIAELRRTQERMIEGGVASMPQERLLSNGSDFHEELIRMSNNPFFFSALQRVNRMRRLMEYRAKINRERLLEQCGEHLEILSLLERGEIAEASYFMRRHLGGALKRKSPIAWTWSTQAREVMLSR